MFAAAKDSRFEANEIPVELICVVPQTSRHLAAKLLDASDVVPLSNRQCRTLSCRVDTDDRFNKAIARNKKKLDSILGRELAHKGIPTVYSAETLAKVIKEQSSMIASLTGGRFGFSGRILRDTLIIHHECSGRESVPMKNVPIVIFLGRKPARVYHTVGMWPGPPAELDNRTEATVEPWNRK